MKVLLYINPEKDLNGEHLSLIKSLLVKHGIDFDCFQEENVPVKSNYAALIAVGGDGTVLHRTEFANISGIPIIGINCGKLGFLSEFEIFEAEDAITLLKKGELVADERLTLKISVKGKTFYALNDLSVSRLYEQNKRLVVNLKAKIGSATLQEVIGDGLIVATPTGSTAYSLSAGGAILEPHIKAFCITPIATHSFLSRSVVCSSENVCEISHEGGSDAGVFVDGKLVDVLSQGDYVSVSSAENKTVFLRKRGFDFFSRLNMKMQNR